MLGDLTEKVQSSQNAFERLVSRIPGFGGYKQKEQRREADKLLRLYVARQYEEQLTRLNAIQAELASQGDLRTLLALERVTIKLQLLIDRIKNASYGYSGLFDAVKVDEAALDKLYEFDRGMVDGVETISVLLDKLAGAVGLQQSAATEARELTAALEELNATYSRRQDVILE
jgi:hypothetical protein